MPNADDLICAALRGEGPPWPAQEATADQVLVRARIHGVGPLLHSCMGSSDWPAPVLQALRSQSVSRAAWELRHQHLVTRTLEALDVAGIQPVLIKGTALAYSLYSDAMLRSRGDTDLLIPVDSKTQVHDILVSLGYEKSLGVSGEFISYQANYVQRTPGGGAHALDVHWKINNSEVLSRLFLFDELAREALPIPGLGRSARGTSRVHAMLIACMHLATHETHPYYVDGEPHHDPYRLIWLTDVHLLAQALSDAEWRSVIDSARKKGLSSVLQKTLRRTQACWHTALDDRMLSALDDAGEHQTASSYLSSGKLRQQWLDFRAIRTAHGKATFLRELLFPSAEYMAARFGTAPAPLLWLYLRRAARGILKRMSFTKPL